MAIGRIEVHPLEVRGLAFQVYVSDSGTFYAVGPDETEWAHGGTREALHTELMAKTRKNAAKVSVPFTRWWGTTGDDGWGVGIHGGNGNLVVRWKDTGTTEQDTRGYSASDCRPLTKAERDELAALNVAMSQAQGAYFARLKELKLDVKAQVTEAVAEAIRG